MAGSYEGCFMDDDSIYTVQISSQNLIRVDSINLFLTYDAANWVFEGYQILDDAFNQTTDGNVPLSVDDDAAGTLNIHWDEKETRGIFGESTSYDAFITLSFRATGNPGSYTTPLAWTSDSKIFVCGGESSPDIPYVEYTDVAFTDGEIKATLAYPTITYTVEPEMPACPDEPVTITVTDPVGDNMLYSFNGLTWTDNPVANAYPGVNTVQVMNAETGCVSVLQEIVVDAPAELEYELEITDESCERQGEIQFNITTPSSPEYTYWVVPELDFYQVLNVLYYEGEEEPELAVYQISTNQVLRPEGYYYVAVQDGNGCISLADEDVWQPVYIDGSSVVDATITATVDTVICAGGSDGEITVSNVINGQVATDADYEVWVNGEFYENYANPTVISGLTPGTYTIEVMDTVDCTYSEDITIVDVAPWTFDVEYTDAPCADATATLWVSAVYDGEGEELDIATLGGVSFHVVGGTAMMPIDTTIAVGDTLTGISAANYSAWIQDTESGCAAVAYVNSDGSGNTIPILDDGSITFAVNTTDETCFGAADGSIEVYDITRSCVSCNEGAYYEYMVMADTASAVSFESEWITADSVINVLEPADYWVIVRDSTKTDSVCASYQKVTISGADSELTLTIDSVYSPTCNLGNDGYVKMEVTGGTAPYVYSVDYSPNWRTYAPFGLTEGEHVLTVKDAQGCLMDTVIFVDSVPAIEIDAATANEITCPGEGAAVDVWFLSEGVYTDSSAYSYYYSDEESTVFAGATPFYPSWDASATELPAGTWYIGAMDPNGCTSNIVSVSVDSVEELEVVFSSEDATCYGTWSGRVNIEVTAGFPDSAFMYTFANTPQALNRADSLMNWYYFIEGETTESVEMQKGEYYFKVKGSCDQYSEAEFIKVDGYDAIDVTPIDSVVPVTCFGGNNGAIVVTDEVSGGAPAYGVEGAKYVYTLYDADDAVVGTEMTDVPAWTSLSAGTYMLYVYDNTDLDADPTMCPPDSVSVTVVEYPELMIEDIVTYGVSCAGENNGEIHVFIEGGLGGVSNLEGAEAATTADGNAYQVTVNSIVGDQGYSLELGDLIDTVVFQTQGGDFEIMVTDANGCSVVDTVTVVEPAEWMVETTIEEPSDCGVKDGVITAVITGGLEDTPIEVSFDGVVLGDTYMSGDTVVLMDTAVYSVDYILTLNNVESDVMLVDEQCDYTDTILIEQFNPFIFSVESECTKCFGTNSGTVKITDISGGSGAYQFQFVDAALDDYDAEDESRWWPKDASGENMYVSDSVVFDTLPGDITYKVYLRDSEGFTLAKCCRPERVYVCEADSLELVNVNLVNGVVCAGDSTGAIAIEAMGGTPPYQYAYTRTELGDNGYPYQGLPSVDSLTWFDNDTITNLPIGTYIGWVMDANGCLTGCEINEQGLPIDDHRVVLLDEGAVEVDSIAVTEPTCYGGEATVELYGVSTGVSSSELTFMLEGVNYLGDTVSYSYTKAAGMTDYELDGVVAPMEGEAYVLTVKTDLDCEASGVDVAFGQPETYAVSMSIVGEGICVGESQAVVILETEGGTAPFTFDIYADGELYAGSSTNVNHVVDLGAEYVVISTDAKGCTATDTLMLEIPEEVTFSVEDATCYGDTLASAFVTAQGTPGREFKATWVEFEGDAVVASGSSDWFESEIRLDQVFKYDDTNVEDVHFEITVVDDQNCQAGIDTITFDAVTGPLDIVNVMTTTGDCNAEVDFEVVGGSAPYHVEIDGEVVGDGIDVSENVILSLGGGVHAVSVVDDHGCTYTDTIVTEYSIVRDTMVTMYVGDTLQFTDVEAGVDSTITAAGTYVFEYLQDSTCSAILNLTVDAVEKSAPVLVEVSPNDSTIADNHPTLIITFEDDVTFNEAGYLWITAEGATEESVMVEVTADMFSGNTVTVTYDAAVSGGLDLNTTYVVNVDSGVVMGDGLVWDGIADDTTWTFTTGAEFLTGIEDGFETIEYNVYPNPFTTVVKIDNGQKLDRVIVSNIAGQRVLDIVNPSNEIETGNLVTGVYVVTLISNGEIVKSERIIKR